MNETTKAENRRLNGKLWAASVCPRKCELCYDDDHHWMFDAEQMGCRHCPAKREIRDDDEG